MYLNPKKYNLNSRVLIKQPTPNHIIIVVDRKSRIIMKDGLRINEQKQAINQVKPNVKISFQTTAPICSKTKEYLLSKNISIINS